MERQFKWLPALHNRGEYATRTLAVPLKPTRVWTLEGYHDEHRSPPTRLVAREGDGAVLEKHWTWRGKVLRYFARTVPAAQGVWLLLEFTEEYTDGS